jgi:hypothetical protein
LERNETNDMMMLFSTTSSCTEYESLSKLYSTLYDSVLRKNMMHHYGPQTTNKFVPRQAPLRDKCRNKTDCIRQLRNSIVKYHGSGWNDILPTASSS